MVWIRPRVGLCCNCNAPKPSYVDLINPELSRGIQQVIVGYAYLPLQNVFAWGWNLLFTSWVGGE